MMGRSPFLKDIEEMHKMKDCSYCSCLTSSKPHSFSAIVMQNISIQLQEYKEAECRGPVTSVLDSVLYTVHHCHQENSSQLNPNMQIEGPCPSLGPVSIGVASPTLPASRQAHKPCPRGRTRVPRLAIMTVVVQSSPAHVLSTDHPRFHPPARTQISTPCEHAVHNVSYYQRYLSAKVPSHAFPGNANVSHIASVWDTAMNDDAAWATLTLPSNLE
eukprot:365001-Chlamydomonas_euryale.AAC.11